jgi:hypothetical protein
VRVNGNHLVRQWINLRDGDGEVWVVLERETDAVGFGGETEMTRVSSERGKFVGLRDLNRIAEVVSLDQFVPEPLGMQADRLNFDSHTPSLDRKHLDRLGPVRPL